MNNCYLHGSGGMNVKEELKKLFMSVQHFYDTGGITKKLEIVREEYERNSEQEMDVQTGFGHAFSRVSFERFEEAVNSNRTGRVEDFRQFLNRLMYEKDITQATISRRSLIKGSTLSRYINGSRDVPAIVVFRIALALRLNLIETETLLRKSGKAFKDDQMDAIIMVAIEQGIYDVIKVEAVLRRFTNGRESLFTAKEQEEFSFNDEDWEIEVV